MDSVEGPFTETFVMGGQTYAGLHDRERSTVRIRCAARPNVQVDDLIVRLSSPSDVQLRVIDIRFAAGATAQTGLLTLKVEGVTAVVPRRPG